MDEKSKGILLRCARIYFHTKNWVKAIAEYENLNREFPDDPHILEQLGLCYLGMGDRAQAKLRLERAAAVEELRGNLEKAERLRRKAAEVDSANRREDAT